MGGSVWDTSLFLFELLRPPAGAGSLGEVVEVQLGGRGKDPGGWPSVDADAESHLGSGAGAFLDLQFLLLGLCSNVPHSPPNANLVLK